MEMLSGREQWNSKLFRIVNSTLCFAIASFLLIFGHFLVISLLAQHYNINTTIYLNEIHFSAPKNYWFPKNVAIIYGSSFVFYFVTAVIAFILYRKLEQFDVPAKLVLVWLYVLGISFFAAQGIIAVIGVNDFESPFYQELGVAFAWLYVNDILALIFALLLMGIYAFACIPTPKAFLQFAYSFRKVSKLKARRKYFFEVAAVPFVIGTLLITTLILPSTYTYLFAIQVIYTSIFLLIGWYMLFYTDIDREELRRHQKLEKVNLFLVIIIGLIAVAAYFLYEEGLKL